MGITETKSRTLKVRPLGKTLRERRRAYGSSGLTPRALGHSPRPALSRDGACKVGMTVSRLTPGPWPAD